MALYSDSNIDRLLMAFRHQQPDRVPHLEFCVTRMAEAAHRYG